MYPESYSRLAYAERLIASARLVIVSASFLAIWLDPSEPAMCERVLYITLTWYLVYALLLAFVVWRSDVVPRGLREFTHALDLVVFGLLIHLTEGATSPLFVYLLFSLVCATVRWQWRGTLWTAVAALMIFIAVGLYEAMTLREPGFKLDYFMTRAVYLGLEASLLVYISAYWQSIENNLSRLATWPHLIKHDVQDVIPNLLQHSATLLRSPRVLMVWEESEEPWVYLALWSPGAFNVSREPPDAFPQLVPEPLANSSFLCQDARAPEPRALYRTSAGLHHWNGVPILPYLQARFDMGAVLSINIHGSTIEGRLFFLDGQDLTADDLVLGDIVARKVTADLDQFYLLRRLQQVAATEERLHLARNLHDGVLQSLTGTALQLQEVRRLLEENPQAAQAHVEDIQHLMASEQRGLRLLVEELKRTSPGQAKEDFNLAARLQLVSRCIERQWGLRISLKMSGIERQLPPPLRQEVYYIVHEALVNAARHSYASVARVDIETRHDHVQITVTDNGRGFPFRGHYDLAALAHLDLGPLMIRQRIASLGGSLDLESGQGGARLDIRLPLTAPAGDD